MEIDQLKAFLSLVETKSFSKTAQVLFVVQSTISTRIAQLEERIGKPLFERNNRNISLTPAGQILIPYAQRILELHDKGLSEVIQVNLKDERLNIGAPDSILRILHKSLIEYSKKNLHHTMTIKTGHSWEIIQLLLDRIIQIGLVYQKPTLPSIKVHQLYEDEILLVINKNHSLANGVRSIGKQDFQKLPLIKLHNDQLVNDWINKNIQCPLNIRFEVDQISMLISLVLESQGVAFIPKRFVLDYLENGTLVYLSFQKNIPKLPSRKVYIIYRKESKNLPIIKKLLES